MEPEVRREIILDNYSNPFHKESKGEDFKTANANNSSCIDNINIFIILNISMFFYKGKYYTISMKFVKLSFTI